MENSSGLMLAAKIIKARSQKEKVGRECIFSNDRKVFMMHDFHCIVDAGLCLKIIIPPYVWQFDVHSFSGTWVIQM